MQNAATYTILRNFYHFMPKLEISKSNRNYWSKVSFLAWQQTHLGAFSIISCFEKKPCFKNPKKITAKNKCKDICSIIKDIMLHTKFNKSLHVLNVAIINEFDFGQCVIIRNNISHNTFIAVFLVVVLCLESCELVYHIRTWPTGLS